MIERYDSCYRVKVIAIGQNAGHSINRIAGSVTDLIEYSFIDSYYDGKDFKTYFFNDRPFFNEPPEQSSWNNQPFNLEKLVDIANVKTDIESLLNTALSFNKNVGHLYIIVIADTTDQSARLITPCLIKYLEDKPIGDVPLVILFQPDYLFQRKDTYEIFQESRRVSLQIHDFSEKGKCFCMQIAGEVFNPGISLPNEWYCNSFGDIAHSATALIHYYSQLLLDPEPQLICVDYADIRHVLLNKAIHPAIQFQTYMPQENPEAISGDINSFLARTEMPNSIKRALILVSYGNSLTLDIFNMVGLACSEYLHEDCLCVMAIPNDENSIYDEDLAEMLRRKI